MRKEGCYYQFCRFICNYQFKDPSHRVRLERQQRSINGRQRRFLLLSRRHRRWLTRATEAVRATTRHDLAGRAVRSCRGAQQPTRRPCCPQQLTSLPCCRLLFSDEVSAIVMDIGSTCTKSGFAGEDCPKFVIPSVSCARHLKSAGLSPEACISLGAQAACSRRSLTL